MRVDRLQTQLYRELDKADRRVEKAKLHNESNEEAMSAMFDAALNQAASFTASAAYTKFVNEIRKAAINGTQ